MIEPPGRRGPQPSPQKALLVLVIVLALAGVAWLLLQKLMDEGSLEDCVMSGRRDCAPVDFHK